MKVPKRRDPKMPVEDDDEDEDEGWYLRGSGCVVFWSLLTKVEDVVVVEGLVLEGEMELPRRLPVREELVDDEGLVFEEVLWVEEDLPYTEEAGLVNVRGLAMDSSMLFE
jgi:hypothetical protein